MLRHPLFGLDHFLGIELYLCVRKGSKDTIKMSLYVRTFTNGARPADTSSF